MNNALYRKTIKILYNRQDVAIINDELRYFKLVKKINSTYAVEIDDDFVAVHKIKGNVK